MGVLGKSKYLSDEWIGKKFMMLTIIGYENTYIRKPIWIAKCDCGNTVRVSANNVINGHTNSCGCYKIKRCKDPRKHGLCGTKLYHAWNCMLQRCRPGRHSSKHYGDRGITVCDEWKDYMSFYDWAIKNGYEDGKNLSIERIDVNGNYCPENCKFIPRNLQTRNLRRTHWVYFQGKKVSLAEASEIAGLPYKTVFARISQLGWSVEDALSIPVKRQNTYKKLIDSTESLV